MSTEAFVALMAIFIVISAIGLLSGLERDSDVGVGTAILSLLLNVGGLLGGLIYRANSSSSSTDAPNAPSGSDAGQASTGLADHILHIVMWPVLVFPLIVIACWGVSRIRRWLHS